MTIIVEDGSVVTGSPVGSAVANSYVTRAEFKQFAKDRSWDNIVNAAGGELDAGLIKSTDYMAQRLRLLWKGSRVDAFQPLDWPRRGVDVPDFFDPFFRNVNVPVSFQDTVFIPENVIPQEVKDAQMFFASATIDEAGISSVTNLQEQLERVTSKEKVGDIEVQYFGAGDASDGGRQTTFYYNGMNRIEPYILAAATHTGSLVRS